MADSGNQPPMCPCGFWGSSQTNGLCSKCFKEHQTKSSSSAGKGTDGKPAITPSSFSKVLDAVKPEKSDEKPDSTSAPSTTQLSSGASSNVSEGSGSTEAASASSQTDKKIQQEEIDANKEGEEEAMEVSNGKEPSPSAKRDISEVASEDGDTATELPKQKNKKRCFVCNCKLELAIREIGRCRCDYVFCQLHRLPEQHNCIFDHKEKGRQDARDKMVSPKKHIGTSLKRIDSDS